MGEITEALRRAGGPRKRRRGRPPSDFTTPQPEPPEAVESEELEKAEEPARAAAEPSPTTETATPASRARVGTSIADRLGVGAAIAERVGTGGPAAEPGDALEDGVEISRERQGKWQARIVLVNEHGGNAEGYRHFALQVRRELDRRDANSVLIASALRQEGKTTTSCNLALALASMAGGRRIALLDLDLRKPSVARSLGLHVKVGVESLLANDDSDVEAACIRTIRPRLDVYAVRAPTPGAHEILAGPSLPRLLERLGREYDLFVVDSAPVLLVPDTGLILPYIGGCVAVQRARQSRRTALEQMLELIPEGKLIGTFLNEARTPQHSKQYGYYADDEEA